MQTFEATGSIDSFVVPDCITALTIEAFGAEGGGGVAGSVLGGRGARMKGDFTVTEGDELQILVGMRGADAVQIGANTIAEQGGGTGGGGTFVVADDGAALLVAGGGGGASQNDFISTLVPGGDGLITSDGQDGGSGVVGGADGAGGSANLNTGFHGGTGGGGFLSSGVGSSMGNTDNGTPNAPGSGFVQGGVGGVGGSAGRNGGFGGGGSAGFTGGGGGGYSGGGAGGFSGMHAGGGGGSINTGENQDNSPGVRTGDGQVIISWAP